MSVIAVVDGDARVQSDAELVKRVLQDDKQAFEILVKRYERMVRSVALEVRCNMHFAADVSQQAFMIAWEKLHALRKPAAFGAWLLRISRRCALEWVQKNSGPLDGLPQQMQSSHEFNETLDEGKRQLLSLVCRLPDSEKQVVILRYFEGYSVKKIAGITGRGLGTVTKQLSRAHQHLKALMVEFRYERPE